MHIKDYIKNNLFTKTGKINTAIIRRDTFIKGQTYQHIVSETKNILSFFSQNQCPVVNKQDSDAQNIIDEIVADLNKLKYLLTLK
jgi:hypothetical protein